MEIRRHHIIIALTGIAVLAVILSPDILTTLIAFLFMGVIPGTTFTIPSWASLLGFAIVLVFAIRWLMDSPR